VDTTEMLEKLKIYLNDEIKSGDSSKDSLLLFLLDLAGNKLLERLYPFDSTKLEVPARYQFKQIEIALFLYNKQGAEGETSHSENGISRAYENANIPDSLMQGVTPFVGVI
jgi:hypothetical protein